MIYAFTSILIFNNTIPATMNKSHLLFIFALCLSAYTQAQNIAVNATGVVANASAMLDIGSTTSGLLIPRMTIAQRNAIANPATSLLIFQTNSAPGYYYNAGTPGTPDWVRLFEGEGWSTTGNAGTVANNNFVGTTDNIALRFRTNNIQRFEISTGTGTTGGHLRAYNNGTAAAPTYSFTGSTGVGLWRPANNAMAFSTSSAERMRIVAGGNVGIGTINPGAKLHVYQSAGGVTNDYSGYTGALTGSTATGAAHYSNAGVANRLAIHGITTGSADYAAIVGYSTVWSGVFGESSTPNAVGMVGSITGAGNNSVGIQGQYVGGGFNDGIGVLGFANSSTGWGYGVFGQGNWYGVYAIGDLGATGAKWFHIDHPLDPENKVLRHANIESNEILNHYRGNVELDASGMAVVQLPDYFETININFSYHLTAIGAPAPNLHVSQEVLDNEFAIAGGSPGQKVSWTVQAERNDMYMQTYPEKRNMEFNKKPHEIGKYYMPELYDQPDSEGIFYEQTKPKTDQKPGITE